MTGKLKAIKNWRKKINLTFWTQNKVQSNFSGLDKLSIQHIPETFAKEEGGKKKIREKIQLADKQF